MAAYRKVLKEVAEGLGPDDIEALAFSMDLSKAKKSGIKSGRPLLLLMEERGMISKEDLSQLKELLEGEDLNKLANIVQRYMDGNQKESSESAMKTSVERKTSGDSDTGSYTTAQHPTLSPRMHPGFVPSPGQHGTQVPPDAYQGNPHVSYAASPPQPVYGDPGIQQHHLPQQGYPGSYNQQYSSQSNFAPAQNPQGQVPANATNQYFFSQTQPTSVGNQSIPPNYPGYHGNQIPSSNPSAFINSMQNQHQQQPYLPQNLTTPSTMPQAYTTKQGGSSTNYTQQNPPAQAPLQTVPTNAGGGGQVNITLGTPASNHLVPQSSEENQSSDESDYEIQEVVTDTFDNMNINDLSSRTMKVKEQPKVAVSSTTKGVKGIVGNMKSHNSTTKKEKIDHTTANREVIAKDNNYATAKVVMADANPISSSLSEPVQPQSAANQRMTTSTTQQRLTRVQEAGNRVDSFKRGGYELKIVTNLQNVEHYETTGGCYVSLPWGSKYKIYIGNNGSQRCATVVNYDGQWVGEFALNAGGRFIIERTTIDNSRFCFVKPECAPIGSGVRVDNPDNGIISATFMPEEKASNRQDQQRGISSGEVDELAGFGDDDFGGICYGSLSSTPDQYEADDCVVPDAFPFSKEGVGVQDVQRSITTGAGPSKDLRSGATALVGHSNQEFVPAEYFDVDKTREVEIRITLTGSNS